jgi:hypothetical protein
MIHMTYRAYIDMRLGALILGLGHVIASSHSRKPL